MYFWRDILSLDPVHAQFGNLEIMSFGNEPCRIELPVEGRFYMPKVRAITCWNENLAFPFSNGEIFPNLQELSISEVPENDWESILRFMADHLSQLTSLKIPLSKSLCQMLESGGATKLTKLEIPIRNPVNIHGFRVLSRLIYLTSLGFSGRLLFDLSEAMKEFWRCVPHWVSKVDFHIHSIAPIGRPVAFPTFDSSTLEELSLFLSPKLAAEFSFGSLPSLHKLLLECNS
jgi:hypothetical protein